MPGGGLNISINPVNSLKSLQSGGIAVFIVRDRAAEGQRC